MRYVVYGAGAIGAHLGARLVDAGCDVILIARGEHGETLQRAGLTLETPEWTRTYRIPVVTDAREVVFASGDAVLLCMKTHDTAGALEAIYTSAPADTPIFCVQNGVENERIALRYFRHVYGVHVSSKSAHLSPGHVQTYDAPVYGTLDVGRYAAGADAVAEQFAADTNRAGYSSFVRDDVMRWKYAKLFAQLGASAVIVVFGPDADTTALSSQVAEEAYRAARKAGISWVGEEEMAERRAAISRPNMVDTTYNSTWQSALRGLDTIESTYLNGEIGLLGRQVGSPTPLNDLLQRCAQEVIENTRGRGATTLAEFAALLDESMNEHLSEGKS